MSTSLNEKRLHDPADDEQRPEKYARRNELSILEAMVEHDGTAEHMVQLCARIGGVGLGHLLFVLRQVNRVWALLTFNAVVPLIRARHAALVQALTAWAPAAMHEPFVRVSPLMRGPLDIADWRMPSDGDAFDVFSHLARGEWYPPLFRWAMLHVFPVDASAPGDTPNPDEVFAHTGLAHVHVIYKRNRSDMYKMYVEGPFRRSHSPLLMAEERLWSFARTLSAPAIITKLATAYRFIDLRIDGMWEALVFAEAKRAPLETVAFLLLMLEHVLSIHSGVKTVAVIERWIVLVLANHKLSKFTDNAFESQRENIVRSYGASLVFKEDLIVVPPDIVVENDIFDSDVFTHWFRASPGDYWHRDNVRVTFADGSVQHGIDLGAHPHSGKTRKDALEYYTARTALRIVAANGAPIPVHERLFVQHESEHADNDKESADDSDNPEMRF